jgi:hypothetical protein
VISREGSLSLDRHRPPQGRGGRSLKPPAVALQGAGRRSLTTQIARLKKLLARRNRVTLVRSAGFPKVTLLAGYSSVHRAGERRRRARMMQFCGPPCPLFSVLTRTSAAQGPKRLISKRNQTILLTIKRQESLGISAE